MSTTRFERQQAPDDPTLYRALSPPSSVNYYYGTLCFSDIPELSELPLMRYGREVVCILDPRCLIETCSEPHRVVYWPEDATWLRDHPAWTVTDDWRKAS
jgi:hypothetical protein